VKADILTARLAAFHNVRSFIEPDAMLPAQVLVGDWSTILFFESDRIFSASFVQTVRGLSHVERSTSCCLLNFSQTYVLEYQEAAAIFIEAATSADDYAKKLAEGGPAAGWLFGVDRYGCASDIGEWCIYCEKENDVAFIGLRAANVEKYLLPLKRLSAEPVEALVGDHASPPPFNMLTRKWRIGLLQHYGSRPPGGKSR
jgi:hypothetical protein